MTLFEALLILAGLPLILRFAVSMPRQLVADIYTDQRILRREPKLPKALSPMAVFLITALWTVLNLTIWMQSQSTVWQLFSICFAGCLLLGAVIDQRTGLLPFQVSIWIGLSGLLYQSLEAPERLTEHLITGILVYLALVGLNQLVFWWRRQQMLGGGDVVLLAATCTVLTLDDVLWALLIATCAGALEGRLRRASVIRFGPHLAFGILSYWLGRVMLA